MLGRYCLYQKKTTSYTCTHNSRYARGRQEKAHRFSITFWLVFVLVVPFWVATSASADMIMVGGSGGGGGGGAASTLSGAGGAGAQSVGGAGGAGGVGDSSSGGAGGGGGAALFNGEFDPRRDGGDANRGVAGAGGSSLGSESSGDPGASPATPFLGGAGGDGGGDHMATPSVSGVVQIWGGNGGSGGQGGLDIGGDGGNGGDGGDLSLGVLGDTSLDRIEVIGGSGGGSGALSLGQGVSGAGGAGGAAFFSSGGAVNAASVFVQSGESGEPDVNGGGIPGAGGKASFIVSNVLSAQTIDLEKRSGGNLVFEIDTLDVTSGNTALGLSGTVAAASPSVSTDGVYIGTARLGDGQLRFFYGTTRGYAHVASLQLEGRGSLSDEYALATLGSLAFDGGILHADNWNGLIHHAYADTDDITLRSGGGTVELGEGEDKTLERAFIGSGGLTKTGAGSLTLTGANSHTGGTTITGGALQIGDGGTSGSIAGGIINNAVLVFNRSDAYTNDSAISGTGHLVKTGSGTLTLSGLSTYTGMTEVQAGTLALSGSLASNLLTLHDGTTFDASGGGNSLNNGELGIYGHAAYIGDLFASDALLNFYVPTTMTRGDTLLSVTGAANITGSTVNLGIEGGLSPLQQGDTLTLIDSAGLSASGINTGATGRGMQGVSLLYEFSIQASDNKLLATVTAGGASVNPQTKSLAEGRASGLAFVGQGADMAAGQGMASMQSATDAARSGRGGSAGGAGGQGGPAGFGAMSGGTSRYNTGSHVDVDGVSLMTGLGWRVPLERNSLLLGAFFEAGWGNYSSYNSFNNMASVKGSGNTQYYGGGILARYELTKSVLSGLYTEASLRVGHARSDFSSSDLRDASGHGASYDSSAAYYGAHGGLGYIWQLNEEASLDFSTKYLWTHQDGDSVNVAGDPIQFKGVDSYRWRNGARFSYAMEAESGLQFSPYIGVAYDYEFDGEAKATSYGRNIEAPDLTGGTGVGELGLSFKPAAGSPISMDLGLQGYAGVREGITGSFQLKYEF